MSNPLSSMDTRSTNSEEHVATSEHPTEYHPPPLPHTPTLQRQRSAPPASPGPYPSQHHHLEAGSRTQQSLTYAETRSSINLKYEGYTAGNPFRPSSWAHRVSSETTYDDIEATGHPNELLALGSRFESSTSVLGMNGSTSSVGSGQSRGYAANDSLNLSSHANRVPENLTYDNIPPTMPATDALDGVGPSVGEMRGERSPSPGERQQRREDHERHETKETDIDWEAQARRPLRRRPLSTITSSTAQAESRSKNKEFLLDLQYQATLLVLLRLPMLYFSRVAQIFEEADLTKEQLKYMYCQATETKFDHMYSIHKSPDFDELYPVYKTFKYSWESFVESLLKEWKTFNIISALLLGAILTLFQIPGVANDPLIKFTALLSLLCALISLLHGCMYIIRFGTMRKTYVAVEWALEAQKLRNPLWNTWTVLALPAIWLTWSIVLYLVCIFSYVWRTIPEDGEKSPYAWNDHLVLAARILFSSTFGVGMIHGFFVIRTFRRWGSLTEKQWIKRVHHWKQKRSTNPIIQESERARSESQSTIFSKAGDVIVNGFETVTIPTTPPSAPAVAVEPPTPPGRESRFQTFRTRYAGRRSPPGATSSSQATQVMPYNVEDNLTLPPSSRRRWASSLKSALKRQSPESAGATQTSQLDPRPPLTRRPSQKSVRFSDPRVSQLIQRLPSAQSLERVRLSRTSSRTDQADPGPEHQSYEAVMEADESTEDTSGIMVAIPENTREESRVQPVAPTSIFDDKTQGSSEGEAMRIPPQVYQHPIAPISERTNSTRSESIEIDIVAEEDIAEDLREGQRMDTIHESEEKETQKVVHMIPRSSSPDSKV